MTKFMLKCFGITALLLFGVLFGIQKAHFEMNELKGVPSKESIESMNDHISSDVKKASNHDIKTKQETLNKIDSFNVFSAFGQKLTSWISSAFSVMISVLGIIIQEMLDVFSPGG
ncbi:DUF3679 domain-containing protein [Fictibacillus phosphorivorans]|uniref:DUF3679 domain-containing protein n=1 Tax=Fictibacillus phosphorivorans TaxID=1221500 RepID=UPI00203E8F67|nr:DUF3679 domain-containing protein [Fictibacillus phosphorivorans]MCM3716885.1 YqxA family protein [Fictibacillus phosphorivorans]MCM3774566.1 YqxA family protein [Fictibacillus phosphorivorans]